MINTTLKNILQSKSALTIEEITALNDADALQLVCSMRAAKVKDSQLQISFSGFSASKKKRLVNSAKGHEYKVDANVTDSLDFLVMGGTIRQKLIEKAESQGVQLLSEKEYNNMIETGRVPTPT